MNDTAALAVDPDHTADDLHVPQGAEGADRGRVKAHMPSAHRVRTATPPVGCGCGTAAVPATSTGARADFASEIAGPNCYYGNRRCNIGAIYE